MHWHVSFAAKYGGMAACSRATQAVGIRSSLHASWAGWFCAIVPDWGACLTSATEHGKLRASHLAFQPQDAQHARPQYGNAAKLQCMLYLWCRAR